MDRRRLLRVLGSVGLGAVAAACGGRPTPPDGERARPAPEEAPPDPPEPTDADPGGDTPDPAPDEPEQPDEPDEAEQPDEPDEPPAEASPARVGVLCRDAVGLRPARETDATHRLERLTLHHSAVELESASLAPERLRRHQRHHQEQGWSDLAYHYAVDLAGNVYELRDPAVPGDTFTPYDPAGHLQVVCEGNFDRQPPTDALLASLVDLLAALAAGHGLSPDSLRGHRTYVPTTACPGVGLRDRLGDLRAETARVLRGAGAELHHLCGPDAEARVAAIEAA